MVYLYNVYNLNWDYLGCFSASFKKGSIGDYYMTLFNGPILTKDNMQFQNIEPKHCFVKLIEERRFYV
jgi:hypothetical protein